MRAMRSILLLGALVLMGQIATAQVVGDPRARRDFTRVFGGGGQRKDDPKLAAARLRWPEIEREIEIESKRQDEAVRQGGRVLQRKIDIYRADASLSGRAKDLYLAGRILGLADRLDEARDSFEKALQKDKYFYWAEHALGTYYYRRKLWEPAAKRYQAALELQPGHLRSAKGLAFCLMFMKQYTQAVDLMEQIRVATPGDTEILLALANVHMFLVDYSSALEVLDELRRLRPDDQEVVRMKVRCLKRSGEVEKALTELDRHLAIERADWQCWGIKANILRDLGRLHEAAGSLERLLECVSPEVKNIDREALRKEIDRLMAGPAVARPRPQGSKSPQEWIKILLNSSETRRRQRAARILSRSPRYDQQIFVAFIRSLLDKTRDPVVRTLALKYIDQWTPKEALPDLIPLLTTLLRGARDWRVQGITAHLLGKSGQPSVVPVLAKTLAKTRNPYAFRNIHQALDRLSYAYILLEDSEKLTPEVMDGIAARWAAWYEKNRDRYIRYEKKDR